MQVLNGAGPGGQKGKLPLLASHTSDQSQASVDIKIKSLLHPYCDICVISIRGVTVTGLICLCFLMPRQCQLEYSYKLELVNASTVYSTASKTKVCFPQKIQNH